MNVSIYWVFFVSARLSNLLAEEETILSPRKLFLLVSTNHYRGL
jgi:hypothetical protein